MSILAYEMLKAIRDKALESQTKCAYCDKICQNADHLYIHIVLRHKEN